jgi:hypothetical protein
MGEQKQIDLPFMAILLKSVATQFQTATCIDIDNHDFGTLFQVVENGVTKSRYQANDGSQLHLNDANLMQTFGIVHSLKTVQGRVSHPAYGVTFSAKCSFVAMGFSGFDPLMFWRGMSIFRPADTFIGCGLDTSGVQVNLSGMITNSGANIDMNAMAITKKYFPEQLEKIQKNQLNIFAIEASFEMLVENVCNMCLKLE